jgi:phosphotransferase system enzyme I (PtsI)
MGPKEAPHELSALLDVHLMLLQDEELISGVKHWITERLYNAEWALTTQLEVLSRQFDDMEDEYLRERKADLEQVAERILRYMKGMGSPVAQPPSPKRKTSQDLLLDDSVDVPLVLVAHDLSPADMLQFKQSVFAGFVTDVGGKTSHTAIVARSMDIPAVVGARSSSQLVRQDDWVIVDGDSGVMIVDPSPIILAEYGFKQRQGELERGRLSRLRHTPAVTLDGQKVELLANIEMPDDAAAALKAGAVGVGLFRSEFLFMGRQGNLPDEEEQYLAYRRRWRAWRAAGHHPHGGRRRRQAAGRHAPRRRPPEPGAGLAGDPLEPVRAGDVPHAAARHPARGGARAREPAGAHAGACDRDPADAVADRLRPRRAGQPRRAYGKVDVGAMIEVPAAALRCAPSSSTSTSSRSAPTT